jgi:hypothetical protein
VPASKRPNHGHWAAAAGVPPNLLIAAGGSRLESDLGFGGQPWHGQAGPIPISRYHDVEAYPW